MNCISWDHIQQKIDSKHNKEKKSNEKLDINTW
jgi:hypothetical protein